MKTINRREFLLAAGATGLLGSCEAMGGIGGTLDPDLTVFISDNHLNPGGYQCERMKFIVKEIMKLRPLPKNVVCFGDLAYLSGLPAEYAEARKLLRPILNAGIKFTVGLGNHDRRKTFLEAFPEYKERILVDGYIVSEADLGACDIIMLDTLHEPETEEDHRRGWIVDGQLKGAQFEWLKAEMARRTKPFLLAAHHPINEITDGDRKAIKDLVVKTPACIGWIHGHDHEWKHSLLGASDRKWTDTLFKRSLCLPSTGHWGDIGFVKLRVSPGIARAELVIYDHYFPNFDTPRTMLDRDVVAEKQGAFITFRW